MKHSIFFYINKPSIVLGKLLVIFSRLIPDTTFVRCMYRVCMHKKLNLSTPRTFNEKLQWLKLYNRKDSYSSLVDKYQVKKIVADIIGQEYVIPTLGVWNNVTEIEWNKLPQKFVIKTTHGGSGKGVVICTDKEKLDKHKACDTLRKNLKTDLYWESREWPYKDVKKRIIAEELLTDKNEGEIKDYKFFCFNGFVKFFKIDFGRFTDHHANYYDVNGNLLDFGEDALPPDPKHIEILPEKINLMICLAEKLATGHDFVRIDLYYVNGAIYFGEFTFFPAGGYGKFTDDKWDEIIGSYLKLTTV